MRVKKPLLAIFCITAIILAVLLAIKYYRTTRLNTSSRAAMLTAQATTASLQTNLTVFLAQLETTLKVGAAADSSLRASAQIPRGKPLEWVVWYLSQAVNNTPYEISDCVFNKKTETCRIYFTHKKNAAKKMVLTFTFSGRFLSSAAKMAILVNMADSALTETNARGFITFPEPLTLAVWPHDSISKQCAQQAYDFHKEVVIFLPLESAQKVPSYFASGLTMIHFPESKIRAIVGEAVRDVPQFAGLGNLFGSRALEDSRVMRIILQEAQNRHAYFIETPTTEKSVVASVAGSIGQPFALVQNPVQEQQHIDRIELELQRSMIAAHNGGRFIISVKATTAVITALTNELPRFKQNGIKLVFVSELVNHPEEK